MIRLLIVDDEPFTVDGLYDMLEEAAADLELDLYRAYSPDEALEWLLRTRIDIVLSDVRMPGMNGLELQQRIVRQWPRCKIIFLTGIHDLPTAQQAMRTGSVDYILKTEGDEAIVRSIRKAIDELSEESRSVQLLRQAQDQLSRALPLMQREWFASLVESQDASALRPKRMQELSIPLDARLPVLPVLGRIDRGTTRDSDAGVILNAVQNIAREYFTNVGYFAVMLESHAFVWLIQPGAPSEPAADSGDIWRRTSAFVHGTVESVQRSCDRLLHTPISLICAEREVAWEHMPDTYERMRRQIMLGFGLGTGMLLTLDRQAPGDKNSPDGQLPPLRTIAGRLERLLDDGLEEEFAEAVRHYTGLPQTYKSYSRIFLMIASLLLIHDDSPDSRMTSEETAAYVEWMNAFPHRTREQALDALLRAAAALFKQRRAMQNERTARLIVTLHQYIQANLDGDLSLTRLSEVVYLNPTYLSELYKQQSGINLSEYIAERRLQAAKELLDTTMMRIQDIAVRVGFETPAYFARFFKKRTNLTPQEYRSRT